VKNCEVIRDQKTGDSLQYAFVEFYDQPACEQAYFKMDNVLIGGLIQNIKTRPIG
jgi:peptidyl-prolyl cis-trans isomerase-like 4